MIRRILSLLISALIFSIAGAASAAPPSNLWPAGKYYGGYPTIDKYLTQGITFRISPDKKTMKDINMQFPADFHDELGNVSRRTIRFSQSGIEPFTLRRSTSTQHLYFAYLDEFDNNWNSELIVKWNPAKKSFKITLNSQSDAIEGTYYKASAILSKDVKKGKVPSGS